MGQANACKTLLIWHSQLRCVETQFHGPVLAEDVRKTLMRGLEILRSKAGHVWMVDLSECGTLDACVFPWVRDNWQPRAARAGLERLAVLVPAENPEYVDAPETGRSFEVPCLLFASRWQAAQWLRSRSH